jgi:hypothetical protein
MQARLKILGEEHLDPLNSLTNLALTFSNQGRWKEAESVFVLGDEHPDTLSLANLAVT